MRMRLNAVANSQAQLTQLTRLMIKRFLLKRSTKMGAFSLARFDYLFLFLLNRFSTGNCNKLADGRIKTAQVEEYMSCTCSKKRLKNISFLQCCSSRKHVSTKSKKTSMIIYILIIILKKSLEEMRVPLAVRVAKVPVSSAPGSSRLC